MLYPCGNIEVRTASRENPDSPLPGRHASNKLRSFESGTANLDMANQVLKQLPYGKLTEVGDFFVEVGEGGFEGFAVLRMGGGS